MKKVLRTLGALLVALFAACDDDESVSASVDREELNVFEMHDTIRIYSDTVFDTLYYDSIHYTSFVYLTDDGLDTLTDWSENLDCDVHVDTLSCTRRKISLCYEIVEKKFPGALVEEEEAFVRKISSSDDKLPRWTRACRVPEGYNSCVIGDSVTVHVGSTLIRVRHLVFRDTLFLNYGPDSLSASIPDNRGPAFDSLAIRDLLDTIDASECLEFVTAFELDDFSHLLYPLVMLGDAYWRDGGFSRCDGNPDTSYTYYPQRYYEMTTSICIDGGGAVEKDTTLSWWLYYDDGYKSYGHIEVTSLILAGSRPEPPEDSSDTLKWTELKPWDFSAEPVRLLPSDEKAEKQ